jgi:hypothetical protein
MASKRKGSEATNPEGHWHAIQQIWRLDEVCGRPPYLELTATDRWVMVRCILHANRHHELWPTQTTLALETGLHRTTIGNSLDVLSTVGTPNQLLVFVDRGRYSTIYRLGSVLLTTPATRTRDRLNGKPRCRTRHHLAGAAKLANERKLRRLEGAEMSQGTHRDVAACDVEPTREPTSARTAEQTTVRLASFAPADVREGDER